MNKEPDRAILHVLWEVQAATFVECNLLNAIKARTSDKLRHVDAASNTMWKETVHAADRQLCAEIAEMTQNTSHAVMSQRHEPKESLDLFPTPPWATRALCEYLRKNAGIPLGTRTVWEPACGMGHMAKALNEYFKVVLASDIEDYGLGPSGIGDFFDQRYDDLPARPSDWIITNPPFNKAEEFAHTALRRAGEGVALFTRLPFLETVGRYKRLFSVNPPHYVLYFSERVPIHKGRLVRKGSTATAYCWVIWIPGRADRRLDWIPPCRKRLEKDSDYE